MRARADVHVRGKGRGKTHWCQQGGVGEVGGVRGKSLSKSVGSLGHLAWKDNVDMMIGGVRKCWAFKVMKFAFDAKIIEYRYDPAIFL